MKKWANQSRIDVKNIKINFISEYFTCNTMLEHLISIYLRYEVIIY